MFSMGDGDGGHASQKASAHHATYTWSICGSRAPGGRPNFRRYKRTPHSWIKEEEGPTVKDIDAGDGVSIKAQGGRQRETTSLFFPRPWLEKLDRPYTQRWKPAKGGDRGSDDRKKTKGKKTIGHAKWISERSVVCGIKEKGGKQERMENMEAKNLPNGRTLTTMKWDSWNYFIVQVEAVLMKQFYGTKVSWMDKIIVLSVERDWWKVIV